MRHETSIEMSFTATLLGIVLYLYYGVIFLPKEFFSYRFFISRVLHFWSGKEETPGDLIIRLLIRTRNTTFTFVLTAVCQTTRKSTAHWSQSKVNFFTKRFYHSRCVHYFCFSASVPPTTTAPPPMTTTVASAEETTKDAS